MERGSPSRRSWADEVEEADEAARGSLLHLPPLVAAAHAAHVLSSSALNLDAEPFSVFPGQRLHFTDSEASSGEFEPPPRRVGGKPPSFLAPSVVAGAVTRSRQVSWPLHVARHHASQALSRDVRDLSSSTQLVCRLSLTRTAFGSWRAVAAGAARSPLLGALARCLTTSSDDVSTAWAVIMCVSIAHSPPGASLASRRVTRLAIALGFPCPTGG